MADTHEAHDHAPSNTHYLLLLVGGLLLGLGITGLYFTFGNPNTDLNGNTALIGWSALDDIQLLPASNYSFALILAGLGTMVFLNSRAWRYTGGY